MYHPTLSFIAPTTSTVLAAEDRTQQLQEVHEEIKTMVKIVEDRAKRNYDKHIQQQLHFAIGNKIWLQHDNISTMAPSKKVGI